MVTAVAGWFCAAQTPPVVKWQCEPDSRLIAPATQRASSGPSATAPATQHSVDPAAIKSNIKISSVVRMSREVVIPPVPSRYLLTYCNWKAGLGWELWDLGQGVKAAEGKAGLPFNHPILSPTGEYVACPTGGGAEGNRVEVWSLKTGQRAASFKGSQMPIGFVGTDRVLLKSELLDRNKKIEVRNIKTGDITATILPEYLEPIGQSPTGKYLLIYGWEELRIYDTSSGKQTGVIEIKRPPGENAPFAAKSMAFTGDGKELTLFLYASTAGKTRIIVVDFASGEKTFDRMLVLPGDFKQETAITYLPDHSGWLLFERSVVDRATMKSIHTLPKEPKYRRMVSNTEALRVYETLTGGTTHLRIDTMKVP